MSEMEDTLKMQKTMERKASQAAKRKLATEKQAGSAHSRQKSVTKETKTVTLKDGGKNEKISHYCFVCGVNFGAEAQLFCIMCVDAGIVVVGDGGTIIKHRTPIVQVFFGILFSFLLGVAIGKENLHSFIMWAIFGISKHDEL
jgi:hypothetical protein